MRTLFSSTIFFLSFFLLGDSRAPEVASSAHSTLVSVVVARPMAELCTPSPRSLVVVLLPGAGSVWPLDTAVNRSLELALEPEPAETESDLPWWSLERMVSSRLSALVPWESAARGPERPRAPASSLLEPAPTPGHILGLEGPL